MLKIFRAIFKPIDYFLNRITMYRLLLYVLVFLLVIAGVLGIFGLVHVQSFALLFSTIYILVICWITNIFFAYMFDAPTNVESVYITALILALIISPIQGLGDTAFYALAGWASVLAISSKFILAIKKKHVFNPAAIGVVLTALFLGLTATWWVGTTMMMPFVVICGLLLVKKIRRFDLVLSFFAAALVMIVGNSVISGHSFLPTLQAAAFDTSLFFFAFIMLTEPLTTPPTRPWRSAYGIITGILYAPFIHFGIIYSTPELALVVTNIFSYIVSPKYKMMLTLKALEQQANETCDYVFDVDQKIEYKPGQYLEWTLAHQASDARGVRRYFTIASSPTEKDLRIGVKFYPNPSTFKVILGDMQVGEKIVASQLAGDFTMPTDVTKKLVFIAGGIGVTPFRSMIKYMIDKREKRDVILMYSNREETDIAYRKIFDEAKNRLGIKTIYTLTDKEKVSANWQGGVGFFTEESIRKAVPDFAERTFYLSGPQSLVLAFEETLGNMGVSRTQIKTDYFPGFA